VIDHGSPPWGYRSFYSTDVAKGRHKFSLGRGRRQDNFATDGIASTASAASGIATAAARSFATGRIPEHAGTK